MIRIERDRAMIIEICRRDADAMELAANDFTHVFSYSVCGAWMGLARSDGGRAMLHVLRTFSLKARICLLPNAVAQASTFTPPS
jgi:hypothetical protein